MILFRKEAEKILKDHGFSEDFTVSRVGKYIWLVGKCGKTILQVSDLEVGSKLSKTERELLIEDYLYPNVIMKKAKLDKLLDLQRKIVFTEDQLLIFKKEENIYIDTTGNYNYADNKYDNVLNIQLNNSKYTAKMVENLETHKQTIYMSNVEIDEVHNVYNKLLSLMPIRDKVFKLYTDLKLLEKDIFKIQRELKIVC